MPDHGHSYGGLAHADLLELRQSALHLSALVTDLRLWLIFERRYRADQPRIPAGSSDGGRWTGDGSGTDESSRRPRLVQIADLQADPKNPSRVITDAGPGYSLVAQAEEPPPEEPLPEARPAEEETPERDPRLRDLPPPPPTLGSFITGGPFGITYFTPTQARTLMEADAEATALAQQVRDYFPQWQPNVPPAEPTFNSQLARLRSIAGRARDYLDQLGTSQPGGFPPEPVPIDPLRDIEPGGYGFTFDHPLPLDSYRDRIGLANLGGRAAQADDEKTVARADIDGLSYFGVTSKSPGYRDADRGFAIIARGHIRALYPELVKTDNTGGMPFDAFFHAEATSLMRIARDYGGMLEGKKIRMTVDRLLCRRCREILPALAYELGNPEVIIIDPDGVVGIIHSGVGSWRK